MSEVETHADGLIRSSADLGKLAEALALAQGEFPAISKDRTAKVESKKGEGSSYSYDYADLADVLSAVRPVLAKHGLATLQPIAWNGSPWLVTRLIHSSGQWIESVYRLTEYERPQDMGSAITYARRYAITALLGIAAEDDDDGQRAQDGAQRKREPMPDCPTCKTAERVIVSRFGSGHYCHGCKGKFGGDAPKAQEPQGDFADYRDEYPNDTAAHERHDVEPAQQRHTTAPVRPDCPNCHGAQRVSKSKYPKPGKEWYCGACALGFSA